MASNGDNIAEWLGYKTTNEEANARFIVTACNSHDELLEACEEAMNYLTTLIGSRAFDLDTQDTLSTLGAAIAKARAE